MPNLALIIPIQFTLIFILPLVVCDMKTVYVTNTHTATTLKNVATQTSLLTKWSTVTHLQPDSTASSDTTSTLTLTSITYTTLDDFTSSILVAHNVKRRLHKDTADLIWNDRIAFSAQDYADDYNCNGTLVHSGTSGLGENLALGYNTTAALEAWYAEIDEYDYGDPVFNHATGHFTQVVWRNSSQVGCGWKYCDSYYGQYTICQYYRPGNYAGEFADNVMPLL